MSSYNQITLVLYYYIHISAVSPDVCLMYPYLKNTKVPFWPESPQLQNGNAACLLQLIVELQKEDTLGIHNS